MSDNLSQEDIDKMLNGGSADDSTNASFEYLNENEVDALGEICNISMGSSATTLSMLLGNKVDITTPKVQEFREINELFKFEKDYITVEIRYSEGLDGVAVFALKSTDAAIIADLMMGGNGTVENPEIGEIQLSAVGEAMNQMIGSASTSLASMLNFPVNISPPNVNIQKAHEKVSLADEIYGVPIVAVKFRLIIGDLIDSEMIQMMSLSSAQFQVKALMNTMTAAINEVVPEAASPRQNTSYSSPPMSPPPKQQEHVTVQPVQFASFDDSAPMSGELNKNLDLLMDIKLKLTVELGRTELPIKKVLELTRGSVIELEKIAGEPVELFANGKLIAKGEVVVIEDNFGLRITSITSPGNRLKNI